MKEELNTDYLDAEKLGFMREQIELNQRFHIDCADALRDQANKVLASILVSASALIGFGATSTEGKLAVAVGALAMGVHLLAAGAHLVWCGMKADDIEAIGNEPDSLIRNEVLEYPALAIIAGELRAKQEEISGQKQRNLDRGMVLNRAMKGALLSPLSFLIVFLATAAVAPASPQSGFRFQVESAVVSMVLDLP